MTENTRRIPKRNKKRGRTPEVTFELDGFDAPFMLPSAKGMTFGEQRKLVKGDPGVIVEYITKYGAGDYVEVIDDMDSDEVMDFVREWNKASGIDEGKSPQSSN